MKIQEAIMKKNALKSKLKSVMKSFEFIWDKDNPDLLKKDVEKITAKSLAILSQYTQIQSEIALKNSSVKIEFGGKSMTLIELILYMQMLKQKVAILESIREKIRSLNTVRYYSQSSEKPDTVLSYEKRKIVEDIDKRIESTREELRSAQIILEKTNWSEEM